MHVFDAQLQAATIAGNTLQGIAHVIGQRTFRDGAWIEFDKGGFERALANPKTDLRAFAHHDPAMILGRQSSGTLRVSIDGDEVPVAIDLPDTTYAHDLKAVVERGDLNGMSFGVEFTRTEWSEADDGKPLMKVLDFEWFEVSPVALPAFDGTNAQLHALRYAGESLDSQLVMARHRARTEVTK